MQPPPPRGGQGPVADVPRSLAPQLTRRREEEPSQDVLAEQLSSWAALFNRFMADIQNAKWVIVITGGVGAMVIAFGFILFMRKFAGCVVWTIVLSLLVLLAGLTLYSFVRSGRGDIGAPTPPPGH